MPSLLITIGELNPEGEEAHEYYAAVMFLITLSFLFTTLKVAPKAGFLIKDVILLGGCILIAQQGLPGGNTPITPDFPAPESF